MSKKIAERQLGSHRGRWFYLDDYSLPRFCCWGKSNYGFRLYTGVIISIPLPEGHEVPNFKRYYPLAKSPSVPEAIECIRHEIELWGRFFWGDDWSWRRIGRHNCKQREMVRSQLYEELSHQAKHTAAHKPRLPNGLYLRLEKRINSFGQVRHRIRIAATWREGPLGQRKQKEKTFVVNRHRSLEEAIREARIHRINKRREHKHYKSKFGRPTSSQKPNLAA